MQYSLPGVVSDCYPTFSQKVRKMRERSHSPVHLAFEELVKRFQLPMFVGSSAVFGDWTFAMRSFEELVERYESDAPHLDELSLASIEVSLSFRVEYDALHVQMTCIVFVVGEHRTCSVPGAVSQAYCSANPPTALAASYRPFAG